MTYETKYYRGDGSVLEEMKLRFDKIISLGTPLWIYERKTPASNEEFVLILSYQEENDGISYKPFFTCRWIEGRRWYFKFEGNGPVHLWPRNGGIFVLQNRDCLFSNEMPIEFNKMSRSIISRLFSENWLDSDGFSVYEGTNEY